MFISKRKNLKFALFLSIVSYVMRIAQKKVELMKN